VLYEGGGQSIGSATLQIDYRSPRERAERGDGTADGGVRRSKGLDSRGGPGMVEADRIGFADGG